MRLGVPTDFLSTATTVPQKKIKWIPAARSGETRVICLLLTNDSEDQLGTQLGDVCDLIAYQKLPNGEAAAIFTYATTKIDKDFAVPSSHHQSRHLIFSKRDPGRTGRPIRMIISDDPKDGDCLQAWEYGGYYSDGTIPPGIGRFTRSTVIATQDTPTWSQARQ